MVITAGMTHRQFQNKLRAEIARSQLSQREFAGKLRVSANTLESWLAATAKSWSRQPGRFERVGILVEAEKIASNQ